MGVCYGAVRFAACDIQKGVETMSKKTIRAISVILAVVMVFGLAATMIGGFLGA